MEPVFEKLLGLLAEADVQFIVVGGVAVTLNDYPKLTLDPPSTCYYVYRSN